MSKCNFCREPTLDETFANISAAYYKAYPELMPCVTGDRAGLLGYEDSQTFARRKWAEQASRDKGYELRREKWEGKRVGPRPRGYTLREWPDPQPQGQLSGNASLPQEMLLGQEGASEKTMLDLPREECSNGLQRPESERVAVRVEHATA